MTDIDLPPIIGIIHRTISEARDAGLDYFGQIQKAALVILDERPDLPVCEAMTLVRRVHGGI